MQHSGPSSARKMTSEQMVITKLVDRLLQLETKFELHEKASNEIYEDLLSRLDQNKTDSYRPYNSYQNTVEFSHETTSDQEPSGEKHSNTNSCFDLDKNLKHS